MDPNETERRFKAAIAQLQLSPEQAETLAAGLVAADKSAQAQGIAFKSDDAPVIYQLADGTQGIIQDNRFVALKSVAEKADMAPASMVEAGDTEVDDGMAEEAAEGDADGEYVGDMAPADFRTLLIDAFQEAIQSFGSGISSKLAEFDEAVKGMGYARTKAEQDASATNARIAELSAELARLKGDVPAVVSQADIAAALKGAPSAPPDPAQPQIPDDPNRPLAALAARTMPALYASDPGGQFGGWSPQPPLSPS